MKPTIKLASTTTPDGSEMALFEHDHDFQITVGSHDLMHSRQHESELELARLGCRHLAEAATPTVLIGGLGMGYTLRQTLDMLGPRARIVVSELMPAVIEWNRKFLGDLAGRPLDDPRTEVVLGDVMELIARSSGVFDAILLDVDNGPRSISAAGNERLYRYEGIGACRRALTRTGCLSVWSAEPEKEYERALANAGLHVRRYRAPSYNSSKARSCFVWVAAEDPQLLPPGGGELWTEPFPSHHRRQRSRGAR